MKTKSECMTCHNLAVNECILSPTNSEEPHLSGNCSNCPFPNAYNCEEEEQSIWINLITFQTWVDGSCEVENCKNYKPSPYIFK